MTGWTCLSRRDDKKETGKKTIHKQNCFTFVGMKGIGYFHSPIGVLKICSDKESILSINFVEEESSDAKQTTIIKTCKKQLSEYFQGERQAFDFPVLQKGTKFQQAVWKEMQAILFGKTMSYKQLAERIHNPKSFRAVGTACFRNDIAIVVPCHRVIGSDGKLTGYGSGLWRKKWLLRHETKIFLKNNCLK